MKGLIGYTGFVGSNLVKQTKFDKFFNSSNVNEIKNYEFDLIVCSGMSGVKWIANKNPKKDKKNLEIIIEALSNAKIKKLVLISTVDVFSFPNEANENDIPTQSNKNYYGIHRYELEKFVLENFNNYLICRITGIVGSNLKKNLLYDLKNENEIEKFNLLSKFQFYPIDNLWNDIKISMNKSINLIHLNSEPISVNEASKTFRIDPGKFSNDNTIFDYDFHTKYGAIFGSPTKYLYNKDYILKKIEEYKNL
jgi:hypothetical protein